MQRLRVIVQAVAPYALLVVVAFAILWTYEPLSVCGGSMRPALHPGDLVLVRRDAKPAGGDIALIREPGRSPILHRVLDVSHDGSLTTRGDANPVPDSRPVSHHAVHGTVSAVIPCGAWLSALRGAQGSATLSAQSNTSKR